MRTASLRIPLMAAALVTAATGMAGPMADEVRRMLKQGADPNQRFEHEGKIGYPIYLYIKPGLDAAEAVRILLEAGADPDATDHDGWTPLHFAADKAAVEVMEVLLAAGAKPDRPDREGATPLHLVTMFGTAGRLAGGDPDTAARMAALLLAAGADADRPDPGGKRPLERAVAAGEAPLVRALLDGGASVEGETGARLLRKAAQGFEPKVTEMLLDSGVPIPAGLLADTISGASSDDRVVMARLLLDHGADPSGGGKGSDALSAAVAGYAVYGKNLPGLRDLIGRLVDLGADPRPALRYVRKVAPEAGPELLPLLERHLPREPRGDMGAAAKALAPIFAELTALAERRRARWAKAQKAAFEALAAEGLDGNTLPDRLARLEDYAEACEGFRIALEGFAAAAEARARARGLEAGVVAAARELATEAAREGNLDLLAELAALGTAWSKAAGDVLRAMVAMKESDDLHERVRQVRRVGEALRRMAHYERLSNAIIDGGERRGRLRKAMRTGSR